MRTAKMIKDIPNNGGPGDWRLYKLSEPMPYDMDWETGDHTKETYYVIASAASVMFSGPETYIFPADKSGQVIHWGELPGSFKGGLDHDRAIEDMGYQVVADSEPPEGGLTVSNTKRAIEERDRLQSLAEGLHLALAHITSRGHRGPDDLEFGEVRRAVINAALELEHQAAEIWAEKED